MSTMSMAERAALPADDFIDPERRLGVVADQLDLDNAALFLHHFGDADLARARGRLIAARKGLVLPAAFASPPGAAHFGVAAMSTWTPAQLKDLPSTEFADTVNRKWPIRDQADVDRCIAESAEARQLGSPIRVRLNKLAVKYGLKLPAGAAFARTEGDFRAWASEAAVQAAAFAQSVNARHAPAPVALPEDVPEEEELATFAANDDEADRARILRFALAQNERLRRTAPRPSTL